MCTHTHPPPSAHVFLSIRRRSPTYTWKSSSLCLRVSSMITLEILSKPWNADLASIVALHFYCSSQNPWLPLCIKLSLSKLYVPEGEGQDLIHVYIPSAQQTDYISHLGQWFSNVSTPETSAGLLKTQIAWPHLHRRIWRMSRMCISNMAPLMLMLLSWGSPSENHSSSTL